MREDMDKVIVERPRTGGDGGKSIPGKGYKKRLHKQGDDAPAKEGIARPYHHTYNGGKSLNEHLSPLIRWLQKQVGRNWDRVWQEVCDGLSVRNATTAHVRDHADQYVEKNCTIVDGKVCNSRGERLWYPDFYVDPRTNILRQLDKKSRGLSPYERRYGVSRHEPQKWVPGKDENHQYHLIGGVWFELTLAPIPVVTYPAKFEPGRDHKPMFRPARTELTMIGSADAACAVNPTVDDCKRKYGRAVYASRKRQLNKTEIRRLKLWETPVGRQYRKGLI